uniref:Uncharacterized protein n=1 Tax=viral metagenome TaxID=1070528 RepID=A0A6H2A1C1_9ZZZZ
MAVQQVRVERDGLVLHGPSRVSRDAYVGVQVHVVAFDGRPHDAWAQAVDLAYDTYGAIATEDNTVGQIAQVDGVDGRRASDPAAGRWFSLHLNLYGMKVRPLNARLAAFPLQS